MSPRAAWRLEQLGYEAYDYVGGKMDWLSFGLPYEGEANLIAGHLSAVPSIHWEATIGEARRRVADDPLGVLVVINEHEVVLGLLRVEDLDAEDAETVVDVATEGPTTVRPSEEAEALAHRMEHARADLVLVTRPDGTLLGAYAPESD